MDFGVIGEMDWIFFLMDGLMRRFIVVEMFVFAMLSLMPDMGPRHVKFQKENSGGNPID